jgi:hypothetical protein
MTQQTEPRVADQPERHPIEADAPRVLIDWQSSSDDVSENRSRLLSRPQQARQRGILTGLSRDWIATRGGASMQRSALLALVFAVAMSLVGAASTLAAPADAPYCYKNTAPTYDMAGEYYAPDIPAGIAVNDCGGVQIVWDNDSGRHNAYYGAIDRLPGGGFIAKADEASGGIFPNGANLIGIKPAERGTIQMFTTDSNRQITGVFHLTKVR